MSLFFPESQSLKSKRQGLRRVIERVRAKFNVAVAEVGQQDTWQRARVGLAVVSNDGEHVHSMIDNITGFVEQLYVGQIVDRELELLNYGDGEPFGDEPFHGGGVGGDEDADDFGFGDGGDDDRSPPTGGAA